jgi:hypothetical protein
MNVFELKDKLISDYSSFVKGFITIKDVAIKRIVSEELNGGLLWPDPLLQISPYFVFGERIDQPKRKDEMEYGEYRTKRRILEIYDQMTQCLATGSEYRSTLNPPPGPPCDENGSFILVEQWDVNNWPKHMHKIQISI